MEKKNRRGLPCPGRPKKIKGSGLVSGRSGRRRLLPAGFSAALFAPRPPQSLAAPSRGAKSSHRFRAAACLRRPFQRRDLLPASPQILAASFRGAKSSHRYRAAACLRRLFQRRDLLPAPHKALRHRSGEQNLHRDSAPPPASGDLFSGAICSPLPAKPCGFVSGSKIFTEIPRRRPRPAAFLAARFAPRPSRTLAVSSRGAKSSHRFRAASRGRPASSG